MNSRWDEAALGFACLLLLIALGAFVILGPAHTASCPVTCPMGTSP